MGIAARPGAQRPAFRPCSSARRTQVGPLQRPSLIFETALQAAFRTNTGSIRCASRYSIRNGGSIGPSPGLPRGGGIADKCDGVRPRSLRATAPRNSHCTPTDVVLSTGSERAATGEGRWALLNGARRTRRPAAPKRPGGRRIAALLPEAGGGPRGRDLLGERRGGTAPRGNARRLELKENDHEENRGGNNPLGSARDGHPRAAGTGAGERQREYRSLLRRAVPIRRVGRLHVRGMLGSSRRRRGLAAVYERSMDLHEVRVDLGLERPVGSQPLSLRHVGLHRQARLGMGARNRLGPGLGDLVLQRQLRGVGAHAADGGLRQRRLLRKTRRRERGAVCLRADEPVRGHERHVGASGAPAER